MLKPWEKVRPAWTLCVGCRHKVDRLERRGLCERCMDTVRALERTMVKIVRGEL